jgi:hypothetical protein
MLNTTCLMNFIKAVLEQHNKYKEKEAKVVSFSDR